MIFQVPLLNSYISSSPDNHYVLKLANQYNKNKHINNK